MSHPVTPGGQPAFASGDVTKSGQPTPNAKQTNESGKKSRLEGRPTIPRIPHSKVGKPEGLPGSQPANLSKELLWKAATEPNSASTTTTPNALMGDDKSPPLSGQNNFQ